MEGGARQARADRDGERPAPPLSAPRSLLRPADRDVARHDQPGGQEAAPGREQPPHDGRRAGERRVGDDSERSAGQAQVAGIGLHDGHRPPLEPIAQLAGSARVQLDGDDVCTRGEQRDRRARRSLPRCRARDPRARRRRRRRAVGPSRQRADASPTASARWRTRRTITMVMPPPCRVAGPAAKRLTARSTAPPRFRVRDARTIDQLRTQKRRQGQARQLSMRTAIDGPGGGCWRYCSYLAISSSAPDLVLGRSRFQHLGLPSRRIHHSADQSSA